MLARYASWLAGDDVFRPLFPLLDLAFSSPFDLAAPAVTAGPRVDILEKDAGLELVCDVPGSRPEDVSVTMENGVLTIEARRAVDSTYTNATVRRAERYRGAFSRAFRLGSGYDPDQVSATLDNGVLVVRVAKRPEAMPRKIPIYFGVDPAGRQLPEKAGDAPPSA